MNYPSDGNRNNTSFDLNKNPHQRRAETGRSLKPPGNSLAVS
jgi:hypothetical protein